MEPKKCRLEQENTIPVSCVFLYRDLSEKRRTAGLASSDGTRGGVPISPFEKRERKPCTLLLVPQERAPDFHRLRGRSITQSEWVIGKNRRIWSVLFLLLFTSSTCPYFKDQAADEKADDSPQVIGEPGDVGTQAVCNDNTEACDEQNKKKRQHVRGLL